MTSFMQASNRGFSGSGRVTENSDSPSREGRGAKPGGTGVLPTVAGAIQSEG